MSVLIELMCIIIMHSISLDLLNWGETVDWMAQLQVLVWAKLFVQVQETKTEPNQI